MASALCVGAVREGILVKRNESRHERHLWKLTSVRDAAFLDVMCGLWMQNPGWRGLFLARTVLARLHRNMSLALKAEIKRVQIALRDAQDGMWY